MEMLNLLGLLSLFICQINAEYTPDWKSLDGRPNPVWYDKAKFGIFMHWGVYSVPGKGEWLWNHWKGDNADKETVDYMNKHYPNATYAEFAHKFTAEEFDPEQFAEIVKVSGAKYFVFTAKHHEGFTMYPSQTSFSWNSVDIGPKRDVVQELADSIRKKNLHFGLYFSQYEWFHPLYLVDLKKNTTLFPEQISIPQMHEIVEAYKPEIIWSDGDWDQWAEYWKSQEFIAWLFNESPVKDVVLVNDRWGRGTMGSHGSFLTFGDRWMAGHLIDRKWENCLTIDKFSWGYRRDMSSKDVLSTKELLTTFVKTIAYGGNMILNVAPDRLGRIPPIFEVNNAMKAFNQLFVGRLRKIGKFVDAYGEAVFESKPWIYQNESADVWYTSKLKSDVNADPNRIFNTQNQQNTIIYVFVVNYDESGWVNISRVKITPTIIITLVGTNIRLKIRSTNPFMVELPPWQKFPYKDIVVLKIENAGNSSHTPIIQSRNVNI